jgi:hypothetical protein
VGEEVRLGWLPISESGSDIWDTIEGEENVIYMDIDIQSEIGERMRDG